MESNIQVLYLLTWPATHARPTRRTWLSWWNSWIYSLNLPRYLVNTWSTETVTHSSRLPPVHGWGSDLTRLHYSMHRIPAHHLTSHLDPRWLPGLAQRPITAQSSVAVWDSSNQPDGGREETRTRKKSLALTGASGTCSLFTCNQNNGEEVKKTFK